MNQRIIKFRAWSKKEQKMIEPLLAHEISNLNACISDCEYLYGALMQFTGLHDKNGVEIFEGDIVKYWDYKLPCWVTWCNDGCASFRIELPGYGNTEPMDTDKGIEVIGNIYQNPELINQHL